jgi:hypothetical protein|eukprot:COSAG01_NODE_12718_length_1694_cov_16.680878_2_plen_94_part_00
MSVPGVNLPTRASPDLSVVSMYTHLNQSSQSTLSDGTVNTVARRSPPNTTRCSDTFVTLAMYAALGAVFSVTPWYATARASYNTGKFAQRTMA